MRQQLRGSIPKLRMAINIDEIRLRPQFIAPPRAQARDGAVGQC
jgi:hypothetical protein